MTAWWIPPLWRQPVLRAPEGRARVEPVPRGTIDPLVVHRVENLQTLCTPVISKYPRTETVFQQLVSRSPSQKHRDGGRRLDPARTPKPEAQSSAPWNHNHGGSRIPVPSPIRVSQCDSSWRRPNHHVSRDAICERQLELRNDYHFVQWTGRCIVFELHIPCLFIRWVRIAVLLLPRKWWAPSEWSLLCLDTPFRQ